MPTEESKLILTAEDRTARAARSAVADLIPL